MKIFYIKIHKSLRDHWVWTKHNWGFAWIDMLIQANKDGIINRLDNSKIKMTKTTLWRFLNLLKKDKMIEYTSIEKPIKILNFDFWQEDIFGISNRERKWNASETQVERKNEAKNNIGETLVKRKWNASGTLTSLYNNINTLTPPISPPGGEGEGKINWDELIDEYIKIEKSLGLKIHTSVYNYKKSLKKEILTNESKKAEIIKTIKENKKPVLNKKRFEEQDLKCKIEGDLYYVTFKKDCELLEFLGYDLSKKNDFQKMEEIKIFKSKISRYDLESSYSKEYLEEKIQRKEQIKSKNFGIKVETIFQEELKKQKEFANQQEEKF